MFVIRRDEVRPLETPGGNATSPLATLSRGATDVTVIRQRQVPGGGNPLHCHDRQEVLVMCAGSAAVTVEQERFVVEVGDTAIIPAGAHHRIENVGDIPAEWLLVLPSGTRFFGVDGTEMHPAWAN